jgi:sporulation integral membrane protein YlbJ
MGSDIQAVLKRTEASSDKILQSVQPAGNRWKEISIKTAAILLIAGLLLYPAESMEAALSGARIWALRLVPALLPFLMLTNLLQGTRGRSGRWLDPVMYRFFYLSGACALPLATGLMGGFPTGAVMACELLRRGEISREETERLLAFSNAASPVFLTGTVATGMLFWPKAGIWLALLNIISSLITGIGMGIYARKKRRTRFLAQRKATKFKKSETDREQVVNWLECFTGGILKTARTLISAGVCILFFSVTAHLFLIWMEGFASLFRTDLMPMRSGLAAGFISGLLEICNGSAALAGIYLQMLQAHNRHMQLLAFSLTGFVLGFSGLSVHMQVMSAAAGRGLKFRLYFMGKIIQGLLLGVMFFVFSLIAAT